MYCWPITCSNHINGRFSCKRTAVKEAGNKKVGSHYFVKEKKIKPDVNIKAILKRLYEQEFTEPPTKFSSIIGEALREVSSDDKIFLKLMDQETVQVSNDYQVPLPLKSPDINFPNNKSVAMKKLSNLHEKVNFIRCTKNL